MSTSSQNMWSSYIRRSEHLIVGIMSGTSLDGIDAALVRILTDEQGRISKVELKGFEYMPYSNEMKAMVLSLCSPDTAKLDDLVQMHFGISEWYAFIVNRLLSNAGVKAAEVDAIAMHGQTVWHAPEDKSFPGPEGNLLVRSTLQIGEMSVVSERTGIPVIGNLRSRDMAAGGEGAPLAPYLDAVLFGHPERTRVIQNIGGIGNATIVPPNAPLESIVAYDTGIGNMLSDTLVREGTNGKEQFDPGGSIAAKGKVDEGLLAQYMADPFYKRTPPKSTGREVYGTAFAAEFRAEGEARGLSFEDIVATAAALTAESIVQSYEDFIFPHYDVAEVIVGGGGAHNVTLMKMIGDRLPEGVKLGTTSQFGIPDDAREAVAFAMLGHESLMGNPSNIPTVTGARNPVILGNITM